MNMKLHPDMIEATRLTRQGRLSEASRMLQRMLRSDVKPEADAKTIDGTAFELPNVASLPGRAQRAAGKKSSAAPIDATVIDIVTEPNATRPRPLNIHPHAGTFLSATFSDPAAGTRAYKLYVPSGYKGQPLPLIVMMHGCTQSPDDFAAGTRMNNLADTHACFVAYPAQPASANGQKCWNWFTPNNQQRDKGEPAIIAGMTRQIARDFAIDAKRIYVAGLSAGGAAAAILAATYPDIYAAVGVHSGLACGAASDMTSAFSVMRDGRQPPPNLASRAPASLAVARHVPTIVFHGDKDQTVHLRNGHHVIDQSRPDGTAELKSSTKTGEVSGGHAYSQTCHQDDGGKTILEMWIIHGSGHAWSGGSTSGSFADPKGPDATQEMVRFFFEHRRGQI